MSKESSVSLTKPKNRVASPSRNKSIEDLSHNMLFNCLGFN